MKPVLSTVMVFALALFSACGAIDSSKESSGPLWDTLSTQAEQEPFCPEGSEYLASHRMCVTEESAIGPFSKDMVERCIRYGGGEVTCKGNSWSRDFALKIRGNGRCMPGARLEDDVNLCVVDNEAFGPFTVAQVATCRERGGGDVCSTMRVVRGFVAMYPDPYQGERNYIRITRRTWYLYGGLYALRMELLSPDSVPLDGMWTVSGQDYAQYFRRAGESRRGSYEPLPEGLWTVRRPAIGTNGIVWAGSEGDYSTYINPGLGPNFLEIVMQEGFKTARTAIGIHLDGNRAAYPGTAGCVGIPTMAELKRFVGWFKNDVMAPRTVVVDYGRGTIPDTFSFLPAPADFVGHSNGADELMSLRERLGDMGLRD